MKEGIRRWARTVDGSTYMRGKSRLIEKIRREDCVYERNENEAI